MQNNIISKTIKTQELVDKYLDQSLCMGLCKKCPNYGKRWSCPPFENDFDFSKFETVEIILNKIPSVGDVIDQFKKARIDFDNYILNLEKQTPNSLSFYAGSCIKCPVDKCARLENKPCINKESFRLSLESVGFNVSKISDEIFDIKIQWNNKGEKPKYLTMVACLWHK